MARIVNKLPVKHSTPMYSKPGPVRGNQILISVSQNPLYFFENLDMVSRKLSFLEQKGAQFVITHLWFPR